MLVLGIILAHFFGDYIFQNDWIANEKTKRWGPALIHGLAYSIGYAVLLAYFVPDMTAWRYVWTLVIIAGTHVVIDRFRLVKQLIWAVNQVSPRNFRYTWAEAKANSGYTAAKPVWMSVWLMIVVDNSVHLLINALAIGLIR